MNVYIAAPWARRYEVPAVAAQVVAAGHTITSRWHSIWIDTDSDDPIVLAQEAVNDLADVAASSQMLVLNLEKSEGKAVEQGLALAFGIPIIIIGDIRLNVFQFLPQVRLVATVEEALALVKSE